MNLGESMGKKKKKSANGVLITNGWTYHDYMHSPEWKKKRQEAFSLHGRYCAACASNSNLHVHHKTYSSLGQENIDKDLVVLCYKHHKGVHKSYDLAKKANYATSLRSVTEDYIAKVKIDIKQKLNL